MNLFRKLSVWYVFAIPVVAGLSSLEYRIGGFNYTGFLWLAMLSVGVYLLAMNQLTGVNPPPIFHCWPWFVWCGYVWLSLFWCDPLGRDNIQDALKFTAPLLVALVAASAVRTTADLRLIVCGFVIQIFLISLYTIAFASHRFDLEWMETHQRATALAAVLAGCVFAAQFPRRKLLPILGWIACLLVTTLTSSRMATFSLLVAPMLHPYFRGKWMWKLAGAGAFAVLGFALLQTQSFQEHFFESGKGGLKDLASGDIKDLGRGDGWAGVWNESWHHPLVGAGVGASTGFVPTVWEEVHHVHNDYLRVFFEFGVVGLVLFLFVYAWQLRTLRRQIASMDDGIIRSMFIAAMLGFVAQLISSATDNTVIYSLHYTNPLFALMGAGYGAAWAQCRDAQPAAAMIPATYHDQLDVLVST